MGEERRAGTVPTVPQAHFSMRGVMRCILATIATQVVTVLLALVLDSVGFSEEALIILFVLGVLVTAIFTDGMVYSIVASALAVVTFNIFIVEPRLSMRAWGPDYPETFALMFVVALTASYLVAKMRENADALLKATVKAHNEQMRADLLRSVSHDLRTPLTSIMGNADILRSEDVDLTPQDSRRIASDIYDDATWLTDVVENLLAVTRFDEDAVALDMRVEVVDDVIEEALRHVRRDTAQHTIVVEPSSELLLARMDAQVIVQVIVNLVNNALAHTPSGCTVHISSCRKGAFVAVSVADDGPGIAEEDRARIFEAFYTSEGGLGDKRRGLGLGLSLCKTIVESHGGTIRYEPADPHGSTFTFTLPIEEVPQDV